MAFPLGKSSIVMPKVYSRQHCFPCYQNHGSDQGRVEKVNKEFYNKKMKIESVFPREKKAKWRTGAISFPLSQVYRILTLHVS